MPQARTLGCIAFVRFMGRPIQVSLSDDHSNPTTDGRGHPSWRLQSSERNEQVGIKCPFSSLWRRGITHGVRFGLYLETKHRTKLCPRLKKIQ